MSIEAILGVGSGFATLPFSLIKSTSSGRTTYSIMLRTALNCSRAQNALCRRSKACEHTRYYRDRGNRNEKCVYICRVHACNPHQEWHNVFSLVIYVIALWCDYSVLLFQVLSQLHEVSWYHWLHCCSVTSLFLCFKFTFLTNHFEQRSTSTEFIRHQLWFKQCFSLASSKLKKK